MDSIEYEPIGIIRSPYKDRGPSQGREDGSPDSSIWRFFRAGRRLVDIKPYIGLDSKHFREIEDPAG